MYGMSVGYLRVYKGLLGFIGIYIDFNGVKEISMDLKRFQWVYKDV